MILLVMEYNGIRSYKSDEKQGQIISYVDKNPLLEGNGT